MHRILSATFAASVALAAASCAPGADLPMLPESGARAYTLGPGDQLRLITFGEDQLTGDFTVNDGGDIQVPLLGAVHVANLTVPEVQAEMVARLRSGNLLNSPSVAVEVSQYRPIFVLGEVAKPGSYTYQPEMTVLTAVALAGGFTYRAIRDRESVTRTIDGHATESQANRQSILRPGDVVNVFERHF